MIPMLPRRAASPSTRRALLPLRVTRDQGDIGWVSIADTEIKGEAGTSVCDGHPWGQVFADPIPWLAATREVRSSSCECPACCPAYGPSPECGNRGEPDCGLGNEI